MKTGNLILHAAAILLMMYAAVCFGVSAQELSPLPIDPAVRCGRLDNGLTYYIRANKQPKERAEFYIAQNAGAILEDDNQNGLAHFLEHMAFNGSEHFPGKGIIQFMEKHGVKFGANVNAYTSLDETVYNLSDVPVTDEAVIDSALLVLFDWSGALLLESAEIDAERGVIREEWRTGASADRRMWTEANKTKFAGSQYAKRNVIGDTAIINNFPHQTIRDFYKKWYRPDLQAILITGDIDVDKIETKIKTLFGTKPKAANIGERPVYTVGNNIEPLITIVTDPEARITRIETEYKHDVLPDAVKLSLGGYTQSIVNNIAAQVLSERFDEICRRPDAHIVAAVARYGSLVRSKDEFDMIAIPKEGAELEGLQTLLLEAEKVKRFGFTNAEIERAKTNLLKQMETAYNNRDNRTNQNLVREYCRHFLEKEPIPGIEWEYEMLQTLLPQLTAETINPIVKQYVTDENMLVTIMAPQKPEVKLPAENQIRAAITEAKNATIEAKAEENLNVPLIEKTPKAGKISKTAGNKTLGTAEWTLANGVRVIFKPTEFKKDQILLNAYSEGGLSKVASESDLMSAELAVDIVENNGLGQFSAVNLQKALTGKITGITPYINAYSEGFSGNSSVADFETLLQLVYLYFTSVRADDNAFQAYINQINTALANSAGDPRKAFSDSISLNVAGHSKRALIFDTETIKQANQKRALDIFRERFANPADFTFILTGNINPADENIKKTILTYLGGLKTAGNPEKFTDVNIRIPKGRISNTFSKTMQVGKASNYAVYSSTVIPFNLKNRILLSAAGDILQLRYTEIIREKEGGTYGVGVAGRLAGEPVAQAQITFRFDCDPEKQQKLIALAHEEILKIAREGVNDADLLKVKENLLKTYSENLEKNEWWNSILGLYYKDGFNYITDYRQIIESLSALEISQTVKTIVDSENILEIVMKPE